MRRVRCGECGKGYDYDEDGFCPRCGAFNQPPRSTRVNADGSVVRVDGLNEANHAGSFVHRELHEENRERRNSGLSKGVRRIQRTPAARPVKRSRESGGNSRSVVFWIILALLAFRVLSNLWWRFF